MFIAVILAGCAARSSLTSQNSSDPAVIVEALETSAENPVELCGEEDVVRLLGLMKCANGKRPYESGRKGLEAKDENFSARTPGGFEILRYICKCAGKDYPIYLAPEACGETQWYQPEAKPEELVPAEEPEIPVIEEPAGESEPAPEEEADPHEEE